MVKAAHFPGDNARGIGKHVEIANLTTVATCAHHISYVIPFQAICSKTFPLKTAIFCNYSTLHRTGSCTTGAWHFGFDVRIGYVKNTGFTLTPRLGHLIPNFHFDSQVKDNFFSSITKRGHSVILNKQIVGKIAIRGFGRCVLVSPLLMHNCNSVRDTYLPVVAFAMGNKLLSCCM